MSVAAITNPSLCSSPPLPKAKPISKQNQPFNRNLSFKESLALVSGAQLSKRPDIVVRASSPATESQPSKPEGGGGEGEEVKFEEYEVVIEKPYGLKFAKGRDGGPYIDAIFPGGSADEAGVFSVGDKVIATRYGCNVTLIIFFWHYFFYNYPDFLFVGM